jgi:DNA replication initiation complex subunit (GINS family)
VAPAPEGFDISQLSEAEQKMHKDAKRFARLLVSEIDLYNKAKVAEGRKNKDLYKRLKPDIDRSRQTFAKRFGKVLDKQFDYFHDELIKTLAANDATVLGPEYPGPAA